MGELVMIAVILIVLGDGIAAPIAGLIRARRRRREGRHAVGPVIWSSINVGIFSIGTIAELIDGKPVAFMLVVAALNAFWIRAAVGANRDALSRRNVGVVPGITP